MNRYFLYIFTCCLSTAAGLKYPLHAQEQATTQPDHHQVQLFSSADHYDHNFRSLLNNSRFIFQHVKRGRVAFLGGSITANSGWRDSICLFLQEQYPETNFEFINAGIPSMGSTPGAFRLNKDVLSKGKTDLLFVEAAVNDRVNGFSSKEQMLGMEGIIRHARRSNPFIDIVMLHFVDPGKIADYRKGNVPIEIANHESVARHYGISTINLAREVTKRIDNNEFTWENDFKDLHPSPFGQHLYYRSIRVFMEQCWKIAGNDLSNIAAHYLPEKLNDGCYDNGVLIPADEISHSAGWRIEDPWSPSDNATTRTDFFGVPMLINEGRNRILDFTFFGNAVGIAVASGPDAGMIRYRLDNGKWNRLDLFTRWSSNLHLPFFYTLAYDLEPGTHKLEIKVIGKKNPISRGSACRIRHVYTNIDL